MHTSDNEPVKKKPKFVASNELNDKFHLDELGDDSVHQKLSCQKPLLVQVDDKQENDDGDIDTTRIAVDTDTTIVEESDFIECAVDDSQTSTKSKKKKKNSKKKTTTNTSIASSSPTSSCIPSIPSIANDRWGVEKAREWYEKQPWIVGCNYIPATAINQLEMWQPDTFDMATINMECELAKSLGFNTFRVYLHDLLWSEDNIREQFIVNVDSFLNIVSSHNIRVIFVFFDDCHRTKNIALGKQPLPIRGVHNSGWLQSPGSRIVRAVAAGNISESELSRLKTYVTQFISKYSDDPRILLWDLYNEPGRNELSDVSRPLLELVWTWAVSVRPSQPLTACIDGSVGKKNMLLNSQLSDVITFHSYFSSEIKYLIDTLPLQHENRPIICTEFMAREHGSSFKHSLPLLKAASMGAINWGLVSGKSQTIFNWKTIDSIEALRAAGDFVEDDCPSDEPKEWFHDIFRKDGKPYDASEVSFIRKMTGVDKTVKSFVTEL